MCDIILDGEFKLSEFLGRKATMEHIKTINEADFKKSATGTGCGECQVSCQTASKVDNTVINQKCEK